MDKFVDGLKLTICGVLCAVSMVLTACFALSFGSSGSEPGSIMAVVSPLILITIGVVIDLSKYLFWGARGENASLGFAFLAVVLMIFSWMASVAFFISSEEIKLTNFRKQTAQYKAFDLELKNLDEVITQKTKQSEKRLGSSFHNQWDKSEAITQDISTLMNKRAALLLQEPAIGLNQAQQTLVSMAFFRSIASLTGLQGDTVRNAFYGALALLIEVCAFGLLSLCRKDPLTKLEEPFSPMALLEEIPQKDKPERAVYSQTAEHEPPPALEPPVPKELTLSAIVQNERARNKKKTLKKNEEHRLITDIKGGKVPPIINRLKSLDYDLSQAQMKTILQALKDAGVLESAPRGRYVLSTRSLSLVSKQ
jgi:hypothetical protein